MRFFSVVLLWWVPLALAQPAPFVNLGFDLANTNRLNVMPGDGLQGTGSTEDLLPGWELTKGGVPQSTLGLNLTLLANGYATLISADQSQSFGFPVEGSYALHFVGTPGNQQPFAISQRGEVPVGTDWLSFRYSGFPFDVSINETHLRPLLQTGSLEAFNISPFAGQTVDLTITTLGPVMPTEIGISTIDSVSFMIPEPSTWSLLALGSAILWYARRKHGGR